MFKPKHHILVCAGFRVSGEAQGACAKKGSISLLPYLEDEIADRGLENIVLSSTGCLNMCDKGPILVIQPENIWYAGIDSEDKIDEILDALEESSVVEEYLL